eukprot:jgi/Tetstr1/438985/TSEL_027477.t1
MPPPGFFPPPHHQGATGMMPLPPSGYGGAPPGIYEHGGAVIMPPMMHPPPQMSERAQAQMAAAQQAHAHAQAQARGRPPPGGPVPPGGPRSRTTSRGRSASPQTHRPPPFVAVRIRPLSPHESGRGDAFVARAVNSSELQVVSTGPRGSSMEKSFRFHACLGPEATQARVMQLCNVPALLDASLDGYCTSILAYGQTGSGKTYTMSGGEEGRHAGGTGLMARSCTHLFGAIAQRGAAATAVRCSFLEIYNEQIYDLINWTREQLPVRFDARKGFHVPELKEVACGSQEEMMSVMAAGLKNRSVGSHELNMESSRSHSVFTIHTATRGPDGSVRDGKVSFVDLAGSERLKDSQSQGGMVKETSNINRSLFTLGKVISALADARQVSNIHVPYRDSKLTKLLADSLGGNSLALFIACCSPSSAAVEETLSTLHYATRAKNIVNKPVQQVDVQQEGMVQMLRREVEQLKVENQLLRENSPRTPSSPFQRSGSASAIPQLGREGVHGMGRPAEALREELPSPSASRPSSSLAGPLRPLVRVPSRDGSESGRQSAMTPRSAEAMQLEAVKQQLQRALGENERLRQEIQELRSHPPSRIPTAGGGVAEIEFINARLGRLEASLNSSQDSSDVSSPSLDVHRARLAAPTASSNGSGGASRAGGKAKQRLRAAAQPARAPPASGGGTPTDYCGSHGGKRGRLGCRCGAPCPAGASLARRAASSRVLLLPQRREQRHRGRQRPVRPGSAAEVGAQRSRAGKRVPCRSGSPTAAA